MTLNRTLAAVAFPQCSSAALFKINSLNKRLRLRGRSSQIATVRRLNAKWRLNACCWFSEEEEEKEKEEEEEEEEEALVVVVVVDRGSLGVKVGLFKYKTENLFKKVKISHP
jgi:hypothetical protein